MVMLKISTPPCQFCGQEIKEGLVIVDDVLFCKNCGYEIPNSKIEVLEGKNIPYDTEYEVVESMVVKSVCA